MNTEQGTLNNEVRKNISSFIIPCPIFEIQ